MFSKLVAASVLAFCFLNHVRCDGKADISDCGSVSGSVVKVDVSGCENHDRCPLVRGTNVTLHVTFKSSVSSNSLKAVVYGKMGIIKTRFALPNPNACQCGVACPLNPDQTYNYSVRIYVKPIYPKLNVNVQLELKDDNGKDVVCVLIPAEIVNKSYVN